MIMMSRPLEDEDSDEIIASNGVEAVTTPGFEN